MGQRRSKSSRSAAQRGQAGLVIVVLIALFLLGMLGLVTDYSQIWAHRQMAQAAADAACQAGAADLYLQHQNPTADTVFGLNWSWIGSSYNCSTNTGSTPCRYASLNGYSGSNVAVSFPGSVPGAPDLSQFGAIAHPYIQVTITDPVQMSFTRLINSTSTVNTGATASCGLSPVLLPIPLVVLHPTDSESLHLNGNPDIQIFGGPERSIEVDSSSTTAVTPGGGSWIIDLSQAGPSGTGSDFGVFGQEAKPSNISMGAGKWLSPSMPQGDPWSTVATPSAPGTNGTASPVPFQWNGCPSPAGCVEFTAGNYTSCSTGSIAPGGNGCLMLPYSGSNPRFSSTYPAWQAAHFYAAGTWIVPTSAQHNARGYVFMAQNSGTSGAASPDPWNQTWLGTQPDGGVTWKNIGVVTTNPETAIFDPGLYYVGAHGLNLGQNSTVRMSTAAGDGTNGAMFYFSTAATVAVAANAGNRSACTSGSGDGTSSPNNCVVSYKKDGTASSAGTGSVPMRGLQCPGGNATPGQVPATIDGNILFGPCSGTYGTSDTKDHGFLFFQNRATAASASWGGGGQFLLSGFMYFHQTTGYGSTLSLSGNSGAGAFTLGNIVADKVTLGGTSGLKMILNPNITSANVRPQLLK